MQTGYVGKPLARASEARKGGRGLLNGPWVGFSACPLQHAMSWKHVALIQLHSEGKYLLCRILAGEAEVLAICCQSNALTKGEERISLFLFSQKNKFVKVLPGHCHAITKKKIKNLILLCT